MDHCFECVGGDGCESAVEQMIETIRPEGCIALLGVSENPIPVNTRKVLEKGIKLFGSSRSGREDFVAAVDLISNNALAASYLRTIMSQILEVKDEQDLYRAFERHAENDFKTILRWMV